MSRKYQNILFASVIACILIVAGALVLGLHSSSVSEYRDHITEANKLAKIGDYGNAVLKYQKAINERPKEEEAYVLLARTYVASGHKDYALDAVNLGLKKLPKSEKLKNLLLELDPEMETKEKTPVKINTDYITNFGSRTYQDYINTNGVESVDVVGAGEVDVRIKNVSAVFVFRNDSEQPEAVSGNAPDPSSFPAEVRLDDPLLLFGGAEQITFSELEDLKLEKLKLFDRADKSFVTFMVDGFTVEIESDQEGTITSGAKNSLIIPVASLLSGGDTKVSGTVRSTTTDEGVGEVQLTFRKAGDSREVQAVSASDGSYETSLDNGSYTVEFTAEGYIEESKEIYVPSGISYSEDIYITPEISDGEARIVLTWDSYPPDLDSYLIGNGANVNYMNKRAEDTAELDVDDTDGFGPETTTIYDLSGSYTFYVHDFQRTGSIGSSGASVTVYLPGQEPVTISVSGDDGGDLWTVFELNNGVLTEIDEISEGYPGE